METDVEVSSLKKKIDLSNAEIEKCIKKMEDAIVSMEMAMAKQRNVSMDIKSGVTILKGDLYVLKMEKQRQTMEQKTLTSYLCTRTQNVSTPKHLGKAKRQATSPAESQIATPVDKKKRSQDPESEWVKVQRHTVKGAVQQPTLANIMTPQRKTSRSLKGNEGSKEEVLRARRGITVRTKRPEAVLIKPANGKSYAEVLGKIRQKIKPEETEAEIRSIRRTRTGDVLLEMSNNSKCTKAFSDALKDALGEMGSVKNLVPKTTLELLDLDSYTTKEEVEEALKRELGENTGELKVAILKPNKREQGLAIVEIEEQGANKLLQTSRIKIGWVNSRVRRRTQVSRCFKWLDYGHQVKDCKGPDRSLLCYSATVLQCYRRDASYVQGCKKEQRT